MSELYKGIHGEGAWFLFFFLILGDERPPVKTLFVTWIES